MPAMSTDGKGTVLTVSQCAELKIGALAPEGIHESDGGSSEDVDRLKVWIV